MAPGTPSVSVVPVHRLLAPTRRSVTKIFQLMILYITQKTCSCIAFLEQIEALNGDLSTVSSYYAYEET